MIDLLFDPNAWAALVALSVLEIVLGIDNVIFISVMVSRLPASQAKRARQIGLTLAFVFRIILLFTLTWMMRLTAPLVTVFGMGISGRDIILIGGGLFLIAKATHEIHAEIEARDDPTMADDESMAGKAFLWVVTQLALVDLVFSLDSIITAIGMAQDLEIMVAAVVIAMIVMYAASGPVSRFVADHPTTKMLALAFLVLIGVALVADGFDVHIPRGYIYFAMAFAAAVEVVNVIAGRNRRKRRTLRSRGRPENEA
jgi:predicted tellurium resistance membrane protein TerC